MFEFFLFAVLCTIFRALRKTSNLADETPLAKYNFTTTIYYLGSIREPHPPFVATPTRHKQNIINTLRFYVSVRNGNGRGFSLKLFVLGLQRAARYVRHATVGACHRTSNRQEHKIIQRAGPEQDTIFHLHVTACRRRGSHRQDERLAWVASRGAGDFVLQLIRLESNGSELQQSKQLSSCGSKIHHVH